MSVPARAQAKSTDHESASTKRARSSSLATNIAVPSTTVASRGHDYLFLTISL